VARLGLVGRGLEWWGVVRYGMAGLGKAKQGVDRQGRIWEGTGMARSGQDRRSMARLRVRLGWEWIGQAELG
jgi:hypothetical protein